MSSAIAAPAIPVNSLYPDRYSKGKSSVYQALKDLKINSFKREMGKTAYISLEDLAVLDEYMRLLVSEGKQAALDYATSRLNTLVVPPPSTVDLPVSAPSVDPIQVLLQAIALQQPFDVLAPQRQLKEAADEGWILSTSQVREIVDVLSWSGGDRFGFSFEKTGKVGGQNGWRVLKI